MYKTIMMYLFFHKTYLFHIQMHEIRRKEISSSPEDYKTTYQCHYNPKEHEPHFHHYENLTSLQYMLKVTVRYLLQGLYSLIGMKFKAHSGSSLQG